MAELQEDCGGPWRYKELLNVLANKEHKRYKEMKDWVEDGFLTWHEDREYVNLEQINMRLEDYRNHAKFLLGHIY